MIETFEKVNPSHPDKVADRIAGAIVDLAYARTENPKVAVEVLIGHGHCTIMIESSEEFTMADVKPIVHRIAGLAKIYLVSVKQDSHLAKNQESTMRCGDNGIFKGMPVTNQQKELGRIARKIYKEYHSDGKYIIFQEKEGYHDLIICQSNAKTDDIRVEFPNATINPLGEWSGGTGVDAGATNRKLGSDMGDAVTGGGLHGKDLSKADVSVNIVAHLLAQAEEKPVKAFCAIGDEIVAFNVGDSKVVEYPYQKVVEAAKAYIVALGGFEGLAEWGLI